MTHNRDEMPHERPEKIDLSYAWVMRTTDVAKLLGISVAAVVRRVNRKTIGVMPKDPRSKPWEWSSLAWERWFNEK